MSEIRTTCAYCGVGCGIRAEVTGERSVAIRGDAEHPANFGKLCSKGTHLGETVSLEGRLLYPMIGERRAGWDEAVDLVARQMRECIERHGPDSVALYVSGQLLTEDYYAANKLMKGFVGSANIDTNSRLCMASAVAAHTRAFGEDLVPVTYDDLDEADLILLVGSNTAWCHPVIWQRIEAAREARGTKIVVIDPRRTETVEQADLHVPVLPDGDVALFNALLAEMARRGLAEGETVECDHGIDHGTFDRLADLVAAHPRMVTVFSMGANQSVAGTDKGNAIINLHLATGRINAPGMGPFSMTGQPNAMGGREVGGLANMLACHLGFSEGERADVAAFWSAPRICTGPGLKAVDLFRAVHDGRVKFLWIMATNPAVSMPDAGFVREALARCETVVVSDVIGDTDTARFAHIRLPALAWGEKEGTVTNSERRISRQRALFAAPGEARADWAIVADVAQRLGFAGFGWANPAAVFREYAAMTALSVKHGKVLDLTDMAGISDAEYEAMAPFLWGGRHPLMGREMRRVSVAPSTRPADPTYPLRLNTGRYRDQWHTMTRTGLSPTLSQHQREPLLEVHPRDASSAGIPDGGLARVMTASGTSVFRVRVSDAQGAGQVFVPMHWSDAMASGGRGNLLPDQSVDPVSGQPGFKDNACRIEPVSSEWRAFLLRRDAIVPQGLVWWSRSAVPAGWLYELAGDGAVDADAWLPSGERVEAVDLARGMRRLAKIDHGGRLEAALYVTRSGQLPAREWISGQLGTSGAAIPELLAARPSAPAPDRGPVVCVCHGIGVRQIIAAMNDGAGSVAEIGRICGAGTNCGSCRPALARMLREVAYDCKEAAE